MQNNGGFWRGRGRGGAAPNHQGGHVPPGGAAPNHQGGHVPPGGAASNPPGGHVPLGGVAGRGRGRGGMAPNPPGGHAPLGGGLVQCFTCGRLGHDWKECNGKCMHCGEQSIHNGQKCPTGVALRAYPQEQLPTVNAVIQRRQLQHSNDIESDIRERIGGLKVRAQQLEAEFRRHGAPLPARGQQATTTTAGLITAPVVPTVLAAATQPMVNQTVGAAPAAIAPSVPSTDASVVGVMYQVGQMPSGLNSHQRKGWKRTQRRYMKAHLAAGGLLPPRTEGGEADGEEQGEAAVEKKDVEMGEGEDVPVEGQKTEVDGADGQNTADAQSHGVSDPVVEGTQAGTVIEQSSSAQIVDASQQDQNSAATGEEAILGEMDKLDVTDVGAEDVELPDAGAMPAQEPTTQMGVAVDDSAENFDDPLEEESGETSTAAQAVTVDGGLAGPSEGSVGSGLDPDRFPPVVSSPQDIIDWDDPEPLPKAGEEDLLDYTGEDGGVEL